MRASKAELGFAAARILFSPDEDPLSSGWILFSAPEGPADNSTSTCSLTDRPTPSSTGTPAYGLRSLFLPTLAHKT